MHKLLNDRVIAFIKDLMNGTFVYMYMYMYI